MGSALAVARVRGWIEPSTQIATIGDELVDSLSLNNTRAEHASYYGLWLRAAATIGRIHGVISRSGSEAASEVIRPSELQQIAAGLWNYKDRPIAIHSDWSVAGILSSELVEVAVQLRQEHITFLLTAAQEPLANWPIDERRPSLWTLLRSAGQIQRLREWLEDWLGENGRVLRDSANDREYIVERWEPFASEIGASDLIDNIRQKLATGRITYRSDRDETFSAASVLLDKFLGQQPSEWTNVGVRLWSLSDAAEGYGCGNNYDDSIARALSKAALRSGPTDVVRLILAEEPNRRDEYWLHEKRNLLISGISAIAQGGDNLTNETKLTLWCLAVGFCRWFQNGDVHRLAELRASLIDTTASGAARQALTREMQMITPAEAVRESHSRGEQERQSRDHTPEKEPSADEMLRGILAGGSCLLTRCVDLVREIFRSRQAGSESLIPAGLRSVGRGDTYTYRWRLEGAPSTDAVFELARLLSDSQLWPLMENACSNIQKSWYWLQGVTDNIQLLCVARSAARGGAILRTALNRQMAMHERWMRGLNDYFPLGHVSLPESVPINNWHSAAAHILGFLLTSRTGEVLASAIHGIHCLVAHKPETIETFFELTAKDEWKARWI